MDTSREKSIKKAVIIGATIVLIIVVAGTLWMAGQAGKDTEEAVRTVSVLYLEELAGRREQVVEENLQNRIRDLEIAVDLMDPEDLSDEEHLQAYQSRMKKLYNLEKFAFVDSGGIIHTAQGIQTNIDEYDFDYSTISEPEISIFNLDSTDKKVIIAVPVDIDFSGEKLKACFMEIDMDEMLSGLSMASDEDAATFCNIYTSGGVALSNTVLGGLAVEDNLIEAMEKANFEDGYSYEEFKSEFGGGQKGEVSFEYNGIHETISYVPVKGTDWLLTYLIRESVISEKIEKITNRTLMRSLVQSALTILAMLLMFAFIISQNRKNTRERIERETQAAAERAKQDEMEQRLALQEQLLEEEKHRTQQSNMISALSSDYWSVYYLDLDNDSGVCYQAHSDVENGFRVGESFRFLESVTAYAENYVTEEYREEFLEFVQPDSIREGLRNREVISYTYMVSRHGRETYEAVRFAGIVRPEDRDDGKIHAVGACFVDVDAETRQAMAQNQALSDALAAAEQASKAKTAFLSNMSHEIRTPMNAIIGLDNIALNDEETPEKIKDYLRQIESSAGHLLGLINDILDMSRIEAGRMIMKNEEFSFPKLLESINTMFYSQASDKGVDYQCHIMSEIDEYYTGDSTKLRQVLINIIGNAVKFTPEGGSVELQVKRKAMFDGKTTLQFRISDTGIGMSKEFLPHIFDSFAQEDPSYTNKYGSSGLGLAIARNIVEMMSGDISVESEKGKGTVFTFTVTLSDSARSYEFADYDEIDPESMSVLIIDDDPIACEHARLVLEKAGISAEVAPSGMKALEMVSIRQARMEPYNLILVDWKMPDMDGVETTRRIREITAGKSAIIILTAYRWDDILEEAVQAGVDSFIAKPLFAAAVIDEFRLAMKRRSAESAAKKAELSEKEKEARLKGLRILLAEDMQVNAQIMVKVLEMKGIVADIAENGRIAVDKFAESTEGWYDAILMDIRMPEMDGIEAAAAIRALDREDAASIPIIALTANAFDEDVHRSLQAGMNAHLSKPVQPDLLFTTIEQLI